VIVRTTTITITTTTTVMVTVTVMVTITVMATGMATPAPGILIPTLRMATSTHRPTSARLSPSAWS
jgi:hypothetical protein